MSKVYFTQIGCSFHREEWNQLLNSIDVVETQDAFEADYIIVWLCAFKSQLIDISLMRLEQFVAIRDASPQRPKLILGGCLQKMGRFKLEKVADATFVEVKELKQMFPEKKEYIDRKRIFLKENFAVIKVQDGCARRCKFCKTNYLNSYPRSKPMSQVMEELEEAIKQGAKYFVIAGTNNTEYGVDLYDGKCMIKPLIEEILKGEVEISLLAGITLDELSLDLAEFLKNEKGIHAIQLEIQSLIPIVRERMGLKKSVEETLQILNLLKENIIIHTSIMVGYPGETAKNFQQELRLIEEHNLWFVKPNVFDNTIGTPAYSMMQVEETLVNKHLEMLEELLRKLRKKEAMRVYGEVIEGCVSDVGYRSILVSTKYEKNICFEIETSYPFKLYQDLKIRAGEVIEFIDGRGNLRLKGFLV